MKRYLSEILVALTITVGALLVGVLFTAPSNALHQDNSSSSPNPLMSITPWPTCDPHCEDFKVEGSPS
jgi:hypothetical protein